MPRTAVTRTFSLRAEDAARFDELVERHGSGSVTEFIREAMDLMEAQDTWLELEELRAFGVKRAIELGIITPEQRREVIHRVLNPAGDKSQD